MTIRPTAVKPGTPDVHPSATWDSAPVHMSAYLERIDYDGVAHP